MIAGGSQNRFQNDVHDFFFEHTGWMPRLINILCDLALICSFADGEHEVSLLEIREALDGLQWKTTERATWMPSNGKKAMSLEIMLRHFLMSKH